MREPSGSLTTAVNTANKATVISEQDGSRAAIINAADQSAAIDKDIIRSRNSALDRQLHDSLLYSSDVLKDGNCFFRALSMSMCGHQNEHIKLRQRVANFIVSKSDLSSTADRVALRQHAAEVMKGGTWVGEDVIVEMANCLQREIRVYMCVSASGRSPRSYLPVPTVEQSLPPLSIAFYEPGHYQCVLKRPAHQTVTRNALTSQASDASTALSFIVPPSAVASSPGSAHAPFLNPSTSHSAAGNTQTLA